MHARKLIVLLLPYTLAQAASDFESTNLLAANMLANLSLEELSAIEVTSVSKSSQSLRSAPAAVSVVTSEEIRRSGATNIPDALRFVPGLNVAQRNANTWAVSARGFSSVNSEKLLVLSDTRSVYTPLFSGVFWDVQDYLLADIDRIEVIRGPGATLWGSNAVNGVINVTTKKAQDTQGLLVEAAVGTENKLTTAARYGATADNGASYRVFGKYVEYDDTLNANADSKDDWRLAHVGGRSDWDITSTDSLTVQGDLYRGTVGRHSPSFIVGVRQGPIGSLDVDVSGGNILARWQHLLDSDSNFVLRAYYDKTHRNDPSFRDDLDTIDFDFQYQWNWTRQQWLWGLNYHYTDNRNKGKIIFNLDPDSSHDQVRGSFIQDQITLLDTLHLTLGTKYEHNDFSGDEWQPSGRLAWDFTDRQTLWTAVSRAVRVPTRLERDIAVDVSDPPPTNPGARLQGNSHFNSEVLVAYEAGYRWQARDNLSLDLAAFHNRYTGLSLLQLGTPYIDPATNFTVYPVANENKMDGTTRGIEGQVNYAPLSTWRLAANYSYLDMQLDPHGMDLNRSILQEGATPRHQFGLRSLCDLPADFQLDIQFRYLSRIRHLPTAVDGIGDYAEMDMRIAKQLNKQLEISLVGQNLLHDHHVEFGSTEARGEIQRGVYAKMVWSGL